MDVLTHVVWPWDTEGSQGNRQVCGQAAGRKEQHGHSQKERELQLCGGRAGSQLGIRLSSAVRCLSEDLTGMSVYAWNSGAGVYLETRMWVPSVYRRS